MKFHHLCILFTLFLSYCACATLYGVYTKSNNANTTYSSYFGTIDPSTGEETTLFTIATFYEYEDSLVGVNTAFDQVNDIFYFADNAEADFVYAIDTKANHIVQLYSSNSVDDVFSVQYDEVSNNIIIGGDFGDINHIQTKFVFMPTNDSSAATYFDITKYIGHLEVIAGGTVDSKNSLFYAVYEAKDGNRIGIIDIATKRFKQSPPLNCSNYLPLFLTYDTNNSRLFSFGYLQPQYTFNYMEIDTTSFVCNIITPFPNISEIEQSSYDPTTQIIYFTGAGELYTYNIQSKQFTSNVFLDFDLTAFAVSY